MFEKKQSLSVTTDIKLINKQLKTVSLPNELKRFIDKNIRFIQNELKKYVRIKKHGSYAIKNVFNFDNPFKVDLLAIKYVSKKNYFVYENEIKTKDHFFDCEICKVNEIVLKALRDKYRINDNINVGYFIKKYPAKYIKNEFIYHTDSVKIDFIKENKIVFSIIIRGALTHNEYPLIICSRNQYSKSFSLNFVKTYKILNKLTLRKLEILFFYIRLNFREKYTAKQRWFIKLKIMEDLQWNLINNNYFKDWLAYAFYQLFPKNKILDELFETKNIYYKKSKPFDKLYSLVKLKNLKWVYNNSYSSTKSFLEKYMKMAETFFEDGNEKNDILFWYDTTPYLKNTTGNSNITMKKRKKLYDDLEIRIVTKNVYPSDNNIGLFLVFISFYKYDINLGEIFNV